MCCGGNSEMTIRLRLTLWYTALLIVIWLLIGSVLYLFLSYKLSSDVEQKLKVQADDVQAKIVHIEFFGLNSFQLPDLKGFKSSSIFLQAVTFVNGEVQVSSNLSARLPITEKALMLAKEKQALYERMRIQGVTIQVYNAPLMIEGQVIGMLQVATPIEDMLGTLSSVKTILFLMSLVAIILSATLGWYMARKALKPIDHVIAAAQQIESGADLSKEIAYDGPQDELGRLILTINGMLNRLHQAYTELEEAFKHQRRFVSDASHELRTPLTTIRGNVDLLEKVWHQTLENRPAAHDADMELSIEALQDIAGEAERMSRLVNDLLALARADAGYEMELAPIEIKPLIEEVSRKAQFLPRTCDWIPGDYEVLHEVWVHGDKHYLQQLLFIFLENAFKYTQAGYVRMDVYYQEGQVGISIEDTGIGMDKEHVPLIFERFYRADESRGQTQGTGLGLSIAKWIIDQHRGSVEIKTALGRGTTFIIWLPAIFQEAHE